MFIKNQKVAKAVHAVEALVHPSHAEHPPGTPSEVIAAVPPAREPEVRPVSAIEQVALAMQKREWAASEAAK